MTHPNWRTGKARDQRARTALLETLKSWKELAATKDNVADQIPEAVISRKMASHLIDKPGLIELWSARDWPEFLGCTVSGVVRSRAWEAIRVIRKEPPEKLAALVEAEFGALSR